MDITDRLTAAVGDVENFARNWSWRSHSPKQRASSAITEGAQSIANRVAVLNAKGAADLLAIAEGRHHVG